MVRITFVCSPEQVNLYNWMQLSSMQIIFKKGLKSNLTFLVGNDDSFIRYHCGTWSCAARRLSTLVNSATNSSATCALNDPH